LNIVFDHAGVVVCWEPESLIAEAFDDPGARSRSGHPKAALFLVSDDSDFIYGHSFVVDGGVMATANFPKNQFIKRRSYKIGCAAHLFKKAEKTRAKPGIGRRCRSKTQAAQGNRLA